jgi:hypothetical protein
MQAFAKAVEAALTLPEKTKYRYFIMSDHETADKHATKPIER